LDAAVVETAFLHGIPAADIHAYVPIRAQRDAGQFRQAVHRAPVAPLTLSVSKHAVGGFVRAAVRAIFAGYGLVSANGLGHTLPAVRPVIPLDQAHAVRADLL